MYVNVLFVNIIFMHEASIAESMIDFLIDYERKNSFSINVITLEIGKVSGVNIDSLNFCLNAVSETLGRKWRFNFIEKPLVLRCNDCLFEFEAEGFYSSCKKCNSLNLTTVSGFEMNIIELEGEEIEGKDCPILASGK